MRVAIRRPPASAGLLVVDGHGTGSVWMLDEIAAWTSAGLRS